MEEGSDGGGDAPVEKRTRNNSIREKRKKERKSDLNAPFIGPTMAAPAPQWASGSPHDVACFSCRRKKIEGGIWVGKEKMKRKEIKLGTELILRS